MRRALVLKPAPSFEPRSFPLASVAFGYLPILLFLIVALGLSAGFVVLPMIVARLTGAHRPDPDKLTEYECGFPAFDDAARRVRRALLPRRDPVHRLRPRGGFLFPWAVSLDFTNGPAGWR